MYIEPLKLLFFKWNWSSNKRTLCVCVLQFDRSDLTREMISTQLVLKWFELWIKNENDV